MDIDIPMRYSLLETSMTGNQLRNIRKKLGLTQKALAAEMGWHPNSVARAEQGAMTISPTAERLARLLLLVHEEKITTRSRRR